MDLIVLSPFDGYAMGARITDPDEVARIRASESAGFVVAVAADPDAASAADPKE
jgi:hypothetical protein